MSSTEVAMSVLRQPFLRRINFTFDGGGGYFSVLGGLFAAMADRMALDDGDSAKISVRIEPKLESAGDFVDNTIVLKNPITSRLDESALCHETLHAYFYDNDLQRSVYDNYEEAACYTVNVLYYVMTGLPQKRWARGRSAAIIQAARPVASAILNADGGYIISPLEFQPVVLAVAGVYAGNDSASSYDRAGDPASR
jgi:hypothetical protein